MEVLNTEFRHEVNISSRIKERTMRTVKGDFPYHTYINPSGCSVFNDLLHCEDQIFNIRLAFPTPVASDFIENTIDDLEERYISIFDKHFSVTEAKLDEHMLNLSLLGGTIFSTLGREESRQYIIQDKLVNVTLLNCNYNNVTFIVNGEVTPELNENDIFTFSDGMSIGLKDLIFSDYSLSGKYLSKFYLDAQKIQVQDPISRLTQGKLIINDKPTNMTGNIHFSQGDNLVYIHSINFEVIAPNEIYISEGDSLGSFFTLPGPFNYIDLHFGKNITKLTWGPIVKD